MEICTWRKTTKAQKLVTNKLENHCENNDVMCAGEVCRSG